MEYSFKAISTLFKGGVLIFEGLRRISIGATEIFCNESRGVNPQRSEHGGV
jgi:hypothetical protein